MTIRHAKSSDLLDIENVTNFAYETPYKENTPVTKPHVPEDVKEKFLKNEFFVLVAEADGKIVGAVKYRFPETDRLYFCQLAVLLEYRKQGIGAMLLSELEKIAKEKQCAKISLDVLQEKKLENYYMKHGYTVDQVRKKGEYYEVDMSKRVR